MTAAPDALIISTLGPLLATRGGRELPLGGRRQRSVLARLTVADGRVVGAERLVDELWNGDPPPSATNTLQSYVSNLRRVLGPGPDGPAIARVGDGYRLAVTPEGIAAATWEAEVAAATAVPSDLGPEQRLALLEAAERRWRGPALADLADEPWAQGEAVRLNERRLTALEARFDLLLELGRHAVIVGDLEAAATAHPLRERFAHQLVLALHRCGRQAEALRAYERTRAHLAEELGLDPSPDLARLAAQVLDHDPALDPPAPPVTRPDPTAGPLGAEPAARTEMGPPTGPLELPPAVVERRTRSAFVGRNRELAALDEAWQAVSAGERRLVTLAGEPGMGKTRLAQHFARSVHAAGGHVLWGRCTAENLIAYQPAVEALRTALRTVSPDRVRSIVEPRPALGLLLPDVLAATPSSPTRAERYELYEALADVVGLVATDAPLVFVIDDLQWADPATTALLDHLLHSARTGRLLVVATLRRPAGRPTPEVDGLLADLRRDQQLTAIGLDGLAPAEVGELLEAHGVTSDADLASSLHARTGGNPFFVESLAEHGSAHSLRPEHARDLPDSVRDLLDQRLATLDGEATRVLTAAAVIGLRIQLDLLAAVVDLDPDALLDVIDGAVAAGVLAEDEELGWVTFPHALVRHALVARTTRNREAQLHLRVADAVEAGPDTPDRRTILAQHLLAAGRACPPDRAAAAAVAAGRAALEVLADDAARTWGQRALDVLDRPDARAVDLSAHRVDALHLMFTASRHLGDRTDALARLDALTDLARATGDAVVLARAAADRGLSVAGVGFTFGEVDQKLIACIEEALAALPDHEHGLRAQLLAWWSLALSPSEQDELQAELAHRARAEALAADRQGPELQALTLLAERMATTEPQHLDHRLALMPGLLEAAAASGWTDLQVVGQVLHATDLIEADRMDDAQATIDRLGAFVAPFDRPASTAYHLLLEGSVALLRGEHDHALARATQGLELGEPAHAGNAMHAYAAQHYLAARDRGELPGLEELIRSMTDQYPLMPVWRTAYAACLIAAGRPEEAQAAYAPLRDGTLVARTGETTWYTTVAQLAEAAWSVGDAEFGAVLVPLLRPVADRLGITGMGACCVASMHAPLAHALAASGDTEAAIAQLRLARDRNEANGFPVWLARNQAELALLLERRGRPEDAEEIDELRAAARQVAAERRVHLALAPTEYPLA